ncbi:lipid kinase, YegS/Rv2252/BmrU family [bacterium A37T11]|nr:lipid kinase, YegS/Rv2252/BmrU family [bacterium A37T11]
MLRKKQVYFIINPIAGGKNKRKFAQQANKILDLQHFSPNYQFTERPGHAAELALAAVKGLADIVVAVGGDGTINEVASALVNKTTPLGIIPNGSGNGLALFLGIPANVNKALTKLNQYNVRTIDSGFINGKPFFNMAGFGFDALISHRFVHTNIRGAFGYLKIILSEIRRYVPTKYVIEIDGVRYQRDAFMISLANSPQYGNNAYISPKASVEDGLLDVCIIKPFPVYKLPELMYQLFNKKADKSNYVEIIKGKEMKIRAVEPQFVHLDGESQPQQELLHVKINPASLRVIY